MDGTLLDPGQLFTKTWQLKNTGSCAWSSGYRLIFSGGDQMGSNVSIPLGREVAPGEIANISVDLLAPAFSGHYRGLWLLKNPQGKTFGTG
ncbi:MAG: NBR1-Ig-like domain-containing protein, partial [Chloroflexi bacterium]|nr:NBR1-Ig-like domain-containing protein [Chloroflexota bacterium]